MAHKSRVFPAFEGGDGIVLERGVSVTSTENRVLLDSTDLNAASTAFNMCCADSYARFAELKRQKVHPGNMTKERDAVESCTADVYTGIQSKCADQFSEVQSCLKKNPDEWSKCAPFRRALEVCSLTGSLGEISKLNK